ncbi:hypothetical protein CANARDRAFT_8246 [[Candida] arabinofermentans NRRL YB-2248]|uniref:Uncharacterized protein n=1 Tax=[Candida] arabinofermentans NRRL YB-2248 TaxID=983967 RepID=A0A1E4SYV2_9ASCO|nr:hypothetical protein CANARDRAFT_8246 [[Candida] arabinofermentans NRRL YB-2248]
MSFKETWPKSYKTLNFLKDLAIQYWFFIGLAIFVVIARFAPNFARQGGLIRGEYTIGYGAVAVIFLGSGLSMKTDQLLKNMGHWRAHIIVAILQFLVTPSIIFGLATAIRAANNPAIADWLLVGLIVTGCCPTTVSSNVVMTRQADGNVLLTLCEVFVGNLMGAFITPALTQMYLQGSWSFANPANGNSVGRVYKDVMKQVGLSVFVPVFVGQVLQNVFPKRVEWFLRVFRFNKVGSFMLLLIMFASFSTAFHQHAFTSVSHKSIIMICFFNVGIYLFFTVICFLMSRPRFLLTVMREPSASSSKFHRLAYRAIRPFYFNRRDTVSIMLCGGAKTAALGVTLVTSQYGSDFPQLGQLLVPLVLYQSEQVLAAGLLTRVFKKWIHAGPEHIAEMKEKEMKKLEIQEESLDIKEDGLLDEDQSQNAGVANSISLKDNEV